MLSQSFSSHFDPRSLPYCLEHPNEQITNFCQSLECLIGLCPDCIDNHNRLHKMNGTFPEIDSIKNVKINCQKKLKAGIIALTQEIEKMVGKVGLTPQEMMEKGMEALRKQRQRVHRLIDSYFEQLELELKRQVQENEGKGQGEQVQMYENLRKLVSEMEYLQANLDGGNNQIQVIKKVCLLDLKAVISKASKEIQQYMEQGNVQRVEVIVNEQRLAMFESELAKLVTIAKANNKPTFSINNSMMEPQQISMGNYLPNTGYQIHIKPPSVQQNTSFQQNNSLYAQQPFQQQFLKQPHQILGQQKFSNKKAPQQQVLSKKKLKINKIIQIGDLSMTQQSNHQQPAFEYNSPTKDYMPFIINQNDYFIPTLQYKLLHFFSAEDKKLFIMDIESAKQSRGQFRSINLNPEIEVNNFHQSIITPAGYIYLTGGSMPTDSRKKSACCYCYNPQKTLMTQLNNLQFGRSSHAICFINGYLYVFGGFINGSIISGKCERLDIDGNDQCRNQWEMIASMKQPSAVSCIAPWNDRWIFKFGGVGNEDLLSNVIEKYDIFTNVWETIDPNIEDLANPYEIQRNFRLLSTAAAVQINSREIFIFGGYQEDHTESKQSFLFCVDTEENSGRVGYSIKEINSKSLPFAEGFRCANPIIQDKILFALQNIADENDETILDNQRRILLFNSFEWKAVN